MKIKFKKYWRKTSFKKIEDGNFLLNHIEKIKPRNFLEIGVFHVDGEFYAYENNFSHRDIKPANILITSKNSFIYFVDTDNYQIENHKYIKHYQHLMF